MSDLQSQLQASGALGYHGGGDDGSFSLFGFKLKDVNILKGTNGIITKEINSIFKSGDKGKWFAAIEKAGQELSEMNKEHFQQWCQGAVASAHEVGPSEHITSGLDNMAPISADAGISV